MASWSDSDMGTMMGVGAMSSPLAVSSEDLSNRPASQRYNSTFNIEHKKEQLRSIAIIPAKTVSPSTATVISTSSPLTGFTSPPLAPAEQLSNSHRSGWGSLNKSGLRGGALSDQQAECSQNKKMCMDIIQNLISDMFKGEIELTIVDPYEFEDDQNQTIDIFKPSRNGRKKFKLSSEHSDSSHGEKSASLIQDEGGNLDDCNALRSIFEDIWGSATFQGLVTAPPVEFSSSQRTELRQIFENVLEETSVKESVDSGRRKSIVINESGKKEIDFQIVHCLECNFSTSFVRDIFEAKHHECMRNGTNFMFCENCDQILNSVNCVKLHIGQHNSPILFLHQKKEAESVTLPSKSKTE